MSHRFTHSRIVFELCCCVVSLRSDSLRKRATLGVLETDFYPVKRLVENNSEQNKRFSIFETFRVVDKRACVKALLVICVLCVRVTSETVDRVGDHSVLFVNS